MDTCLLQEHRLPSQYSSESRNDPPFGCFNFMKLSVELRCLVYDFALARPDPISLQVRDESLQSDSEPSSFPDSVSPALAGTKSDTSSSSNLTKKSGDKGVMRCNLNPAILRISKTVYSEARSVLYGRNTFTMSVGDASRAIRLLSSSKRFVRYLRLEFSNHRDLLSRFPSLAQYHLRYFRRLEELALVFPENLSKIDWELPPGQNVLSDEPSMSSNLATGCLNRAVDWLPISTEVTLVRTNLGQGIGRRCNESAKDQKVEAAVQSMIQKHMLQCCPPPSHGELVGNRPTCDPADLTSRPTNSAEEDLATRDHECSVCPVGSVRSATEQNERTEHTEPTERTEPTDHTKPAKSTEQTEQYAMPESLSTTCVTNAKTSCQD